MKKNIQKMNNEQIKKYRQDKNQSFFYYNKDDWRVLVPKSIPYLGWTFNFARPLSWIFTALIIIPVIVAIVLQLLKK